jgi:hypothetical protein
MYSNVAFSEISVPVDDSAAINFFEDSQLVVSKKTVNPYDLAGSLVLEKEGEDTMYINILPESIKKNLKPENLTGQPYRTMMTKTQAAKVGFLGFLGISTEEKSLLEVSIDHRWKLDGPSFWNNDELKQRVLSIGKIYNDMGYKIKYNKNVKYSNITTSNFSESHSDVTSSFTYIDATGKRFVQSSNYAQKELIAISPFDITPLLVVWKPSAVSALEFKVTNREIKNLVKDSQGSFTNHPLTIKRGDLEEIKGLQKILGEEWASQPQFNLKQ